MRAISLLSGGKDSFLSTLIAMEQGFKILSCLTVLPESESFMFHVPNARYASEVSSLLGLNTVFCKENEFEDKIKEMTADGIPTAIINGAIASNFQRNKLELMCTRLSLLCYSPLWRVEQSTVMEEIIRRKIGAIIVAISAEGLDETFLGKAIDESSNKKIKRNLKASIALISQEKEENMNP